MTVRLSALSTGRTLLPRNIIIIILMFLVLISVRGFRLVQITPLDAGGEDKGSKSSSGSNDNVNNNSDNTSTHGTCATISRPHSILLQHKTTSRSKDSVGYILL
jgi:hypothetical protein